MASDSNDGSKNSGTTPADGKSGKDENVFSEQYLQRLLADGITYRSPMKDIETVLKYGGNVNKPVKNGLRPLHYAAYVDYEECVSFLIQHGADVNLTDDIGYTPIHLCSRRGYTNTMRILIENGAVVNFCDADVDSEPEVTENSKALGYLTMEPLNIAIENNHVDCVKLLLESGARPNHKYFMGYEVNLVPLDNLECLELLLKHGSDPNLFNRCGINPLMKACREQRLGAVRMLLKYDADVNRQCPSRFEQKTAIHFAIEAGNAGIVQTLLRYGAPTSRPDSYKYCALHKAVLKDRPDICEMLIRRGGEIDECTDENATALMLACATPELKSRKEIVELLLACGANVNAHSEFVSYTDACLSPLIEYLRNIGPDVQYDIVQLLLKYGAKVTFKGGISICKLMDPFGVLNYISHLKELPDVMDLLFRAAEAFDYRRIRLMECLTPVQKTVLVEAASTPCALRHLVRLKIRRLMWPEIPKKTDMLPLPHWVKQYLLYEV